jgi:hypothetical protein
VKIRIEWMPEDPGSPMLSTRDEDGLRVLFGQDEEARILDALRLAAGEPVTLTVNGPDVGFNAEFIETRFTVIGHSTDEGVAIPIDTPD